MKYLVRCGFELRAAALLLAAAGTATAAPAAGESRAAESAAAEAAASSGAAPSLAAALTAMDACFAHGKAQGWPPLAIAVLDGRGEMLAFKRQDGGLPVTAEVAILKARTAHRTGLPSGALAAGAEADATLRDILLKLELTAMPGGVPLGDGGGAVGVSGASPQDDEACARIAVGAIR